jgi:LuxR family transcriptional regulator, maltose regulon positive regulatory protein
VTQLTQVAPISDAAKHGHESLLLEDKLRVPRLGADVIPRSRLTRLIERAAVHPVTAITAPAGAGKSVACATWAAAVARSRRVTWLNLDVGDREPGRFWAYLSAALAVGGSDLTSSLVPRSRGPADDPPVSLMDTMRGLAAPVALVLDDVHVLADSGVLPGLGYLIHHAPPTLRIILCGRRVPGLHLARMRVAGDLAEVDTADLACTPEEADAYFAKLGLAADPAERDDLLRRTQGWMAGLRLAALRANRDGTVNVGGISGDPLLADYMRDEVLDRQPAQIRLFLRRTSVAERLTGEYADWLTREPGGARILDQLDRENSFVARDESGQYRYHPCLREVLLAELHRTPQEVPLLFGRAARWHAARGDVVAAMRCAAQAGDWDQASLALAEAGIAGVLPGRMADLEEALRLFPAQRRSGDPVVAAALAAARLCGGDPDSATAYRDYAAQALADCADPTRPLVELWLAALRVMQTADTDPGALDDGWALAEKTQSRAGTLSAHRALGLLWLALGAAMLSRWRITDARRALGHASHQLAAAGLGVPLERALGWQALAEVLYGDLGAAQAIIARLRGPDMPDPAGQYLATLAAAALAVERDELRSAAELLDSLDSRALGWVPGEPDTGVLRMLVRARVALAGGDTTGARSIVTLVRDKSGQNLLPLAAFDADIALQEGDIPVAAATLGPPDGAAERPPRDAEQAVVVARLLLAQGDPGAALDLATRWMDGSSIPGGTLRNRITALLTATIANRRLSAHADAAALLEQALMIAEPHDAYRPFLDLGGAIHSAIAIMVPPASPAAAFAARVQERFVCQLPPKAAGNISASDAAPPLTASEMAVLRLLHSHLTNQEIADALYLSVNTIKTHLRSTYHKLGVTSRRDAVARGRRLQLLLKQPGVQADICPERTVLTPPGSANKQRPASLTLSAGPHLARPNVQHNRKIASGATDGSALTHPLRVIANPAAAASASVHLPGVIKTRRVAGHDVAPMESDW